jgi:hypothetical protein
MCFCWSVFCSVCVSESCFLQYTLQQNT